MTPIAYTVAGRTFPTQASLETEIKFHLAHALRDTVFIDALFRDIVNTYHPEVVAAGQRSDGRFEYLTWHERARRGMQTARDYRGGGVIMTYFEPLGEWRDVTVYPWRRPKPKQDIIRALRAKAAAFVPSPGPRDCCAHSGCLVRGAGLTYHHVSPTFAEMAESAFLLVSQQEHAARFGYDKFAKGTFSIADFISNDHPAVLYLEAAHRHNDWQWLCTEHHRAVTHG